MRFEICEVEKAMASVLYQSIETLSRDKGIEPEIVVGAVEDAIALATRKYYKTQENMRAEMDRETGEIRAYVFKTVVESPEQVVRDFQEAQSKLEFPLNERERCRRCPFFRDLCPATLAGGSG